MRNLFKFLKRFRNFSVFIVLQVFILSLFFNSKNYHKASYVNTSSVLSSWLIHKRYNITKHFNLESENTKLNEENAKLLAKLPLSFYPLQSNLFRINDSIYEQQYQYLPATIENYSNNRRNNYATISKGSLSGIELDMGVMSSEGIVGFVVDVNDHYSIIRLILSDQINIFVEINGIRGILEWDGINNGFCQVKIVTSGSEIKLGDEVVTKGSKGYFPKGISVGKVRDLNFNNQAATQIIEIELSTNFRALGHVYVINNIFKQEQQEIEEGYYEQ